MKQAVTDGQFLRFPLHFFFSMRSELFPSVSHISFSASRRSDTAAQPSFSHVISLNAPARHLLVTFLRHDLFAIFAAGCSFAPSATAKSPPKRRHDMEWRGLISDSRALNSCSAAVEARRDSTRQTSYQDNTQTHTPRQRLLGFV